MIFIFTFTGFGQKKKVGGGNRKGTEKKGRVISHPEDTEKIGKNQHRKERENAHI
jgi:hypothetical protein